MHAQGARNLDAIIRKVESENLEKFKKPIPNIKVGDYVKVYYLLSNKEKKMMMGYIVKRLRRKDSPSCRLVISKNDTDLGNRVVKSFLIYNLASVEIIRRSNRPIRKSNATFITSLFGKKLKSL